MLQTGPSGNWGERFVGRQLTLPNLGGVSLASVLRGGSETAVFRTDKPDVVVKIFDLDCGLPDELSYGPYVEYQLEVANFEEILNIPELKAFVPAFFGADIDYECRFAFVGMEYLDGEDLQEWCEDAKRKQAYETWSGELRQTAFETLRILDQFHANQIIVIDFKPENVLRLSNGEIRFVDMGAFFTPRHAGKTKEYLYSATPDYAELLIDSSNVESGLALTQATDIFAAGVALFEMVSGESRLSLAGETADSILQKPEIYRFRDSQIKDVWKAFPHLEELLPLVETQLHDRRFLFAEFWHVLKGYLAEAVEGWEELSEGQHHELLLKTGEDFIRDHLPDALTWLSSPIARATTLRSLRLSSVRDLMDSLREPISPDVGAVLEEANAFVQYVSDLGRWDGRLEQLNLWDLRWHEELGAWALNGPAGCRCLNDDAEFTFVQECEVDFEGHRFFVLSADDGTQPPRALSELKADKRSWLL